MDKVKIEVTKDYEKQGRLILKKGEVHLVSADTAKQLIEIKKVAVDVNSVKKEPKKKSK